MLSNYYYECAAWIGWGLFNAVCSVQFVSASRPSTEYFIRNTGTGSDSRSCHLSHCPHKFMQNTKIQMKHHSKKQQKIQISTETLH